MKTPQITETLVFGPDGGFNTCKATGARVTDLIAKDIAAIKERLVTTEFASYWAPLIPHNGANGRLMESPEEGIVGIDAREIQPHLWTTSLGEDHYQGSIWRLYFWSMLYDIIEKSEIVDGSHVKVFTALGLPHLHMGYAGILRDSLLSDMPHTIKRRDGKTFFITIHDFIAVQTQPFWIAWDQIFRWEPSGLIPHKELLQGGLAILDFGSKTTNGIMMVNNLIPVDHISVPIGTWDVVKDFVAPKIESLRQQKGITVGERWQALMSAYENGGYQIGKHDTLDIRGGLEEYNCEKVVQRIKEVDTKLDGGANTRTMLLAGGDVGVNFPAFEEKYAQNISGDFKITTDDDGKEEPMYRQMNGACKGAIFAWNKSLA